MPKVRLLTLTDEPYHPNSVPKKSKPSGSKELRWFSVWDQMVMVIDPNMMMSEYDIQGNKVFENGFEKLSHYFDEDEMEY